MAWTIGIGKVSILRISCFRDLAANVGLWRQRSRTRKQLMFLDDYQLRDIGLDRQSALEEAYKPFWRG